MDNFFAIWDILWKEGIKASVAHYYWGLRKILCWGCLTVYCFFGEKKGIAFKSSLTVLLCIDFLILLICLVTVQNWGKMHTTGVVDVSSGNEEFWKMLCMAGMEESHGEWVSLGSWRKLCALLPRLPVSIFGNDIIVLKCNWTLKQFELVSKLVKLVIKNLLKKNQTSNRYY